MPSSLRHETFTVCLPGLEPLVAAELADLGARPGPRTGGVRATLSPRQLGAANLGLRTATRVLVRVGRFEARTFADFQAAVTRLDWAPFIAPGAAVRVRAASHGSALWHTGALAERVLTAIPGAVPHEADDDPDDGTDHPRDDRDDRPGPQTVLVRVDRDQVTMSIDTSGEPLHRRGWRGPTAKAPLRPTLAAAMLLASGWDGRSPLIDPFCGSGTIPVEAALLARGLPPGGQRSFAFHAWPSFEPGTWASVVGAARAGERPAAGVPILARDRDDGAVAATRINAERAGVAGDLDVGRATVSDLGPPAGGDGPGWVLTNPPYGHRIRGGADLRDLYARLGQVVGTRLPDWDVGLLVGDPALAGHTRLPLTRRWRSANGGIPVHFLTTGPEGPA